MRGVGGEESFLRHIRIRRRLSGSQTGDKVRAATPAFQAGGLPVQAGKQSPGLARV